MQSLLSSFFCLTAVLRFGDNDLSALAPKGDCPICCPVDEEKDIRYLLYTSRGRPRVQGLELPQESPGTAARTAGADPSLPTVIYLHGFSETAPGPSTSSASNIKDAYLARGGYNVILVDWGKLTAAPWYADSARNVNKMAENLARFLSRLDEGGIKLSTVHIVGFSLGAEAAGMAGKILTNGLKIPRITGLDPAFPLFSATEKDKRLSSGDANFVDVIHTDGGFLGFPTPIGDADFFPNGGMPVQPGCQLQDLGEVARRFDVFGVVGCSHGRAWQLYADSVRNPQDFPATRCWDWKGEQAQCRFETDSYLGFAANNKSHGRFYLETNSKSPYGKGLPK